jgi:hypothetical protein
VRTNTSQVRNGQITLTTAGSTLVEAIINTEF